MGYPTTKKLGLEEFWDDVMREIDRGELREAFGQRDLSKGRRYCREGYVKKGVKVGDQLAGLVVGSNPEPYQVEIEITEEISSECTCPVGDMCKHGAALTLKWVEDREWFVDGDELLYSLDERSKEELMQILNNVIKDDPLQATKLTSSKDEAEAPQVNKEAIWNRIDYATSGFIDYDEVPRVVNELEEVKKNADKLLDKKSFEEAIDIYLMLVEEVVKTYERGVDDSSGELGDFVKGVIEDFCEHVDKIGEKKKTSLIPKILEITELGDYGLGKDRMLSAVATKNNVDMIRDRIMAKIPESVERKYERRSFISTLIDVYESLGLQEEIPGVLKEIGLVTEDDHLKLFEVLMNRGELEEAFRIIKEGLELREKSERKLNKFYFQILIKLLQEKDPENLKEEIRSGRVKKTALSLLRDYKVIEDYELIKEAFKKIGKYEELIAFIKDECGPNKLIPILLHEDLYEEAIKRSLSNETEVNSSVLIKTAKAAKKINKKQETKEIIFKWLRKGSKYSTGITEDLLEVLINNSNHEELREAMKHIESPNLAKKFANSVLERDQEIAVNALKNFIPKLESEEIKNYAKKLDDEHATKICHEWINEYVNRSYHYYDEVMELLKIIEQRKGNEYITEFMERNSSKKKLLEKLKESNIDTSQQ